MRALFSTSFTFKWYIWVLLCGNVCIFSTLLSSCESRQEQTQETKIMSKWVNNTEVIMMHLFFSSKSSEETLHSFSSFQAAWGSLFQTLPAWHAAPGVGFLSLSCLPCSIWFRHGGQTPDWLPSLPDSRTEYLLFFWPHLVHKPEIDPMLSNELQVKFK